MALIETDSSVDTIFYKVYSSTLHSTQTVINDPLYECRLNIYDFKQYCQYREISF